FLGSLLIVNKTTMPSNPKKGKTLKCSENLKDFYENDDEFKFHEASSVKSEQQQHQQKANVPVVKSKKRQAMTPADDFQDSDPEDDYGDKSSDLEMQGILNSFGADITKTLTAKRKRIQTFTQASLKASSRKFDEVWHTQQRERSSHYDEFSKQLMNVITQGETDLQKTREAEEKLEKCFETKTELLFGKFRRIKSFQGVKIISVVCDEAPSSISGIETFRKKHRFLFPQPLTLTFSFHFFSNNRTSQVCEGLFKACLHKYK
ncbi:unnamed protein product, partial [Porites evermanni]